MVCMEQVIVVITMILAFFTSIPACSQNLHKFSFVFVVLQFISSIVAVL